jgi:hypothetical protein
MRGFVDESGTPSRKYPLPDNFLVVGFIGIGDELLLTDAIREFERQQNWKGVREVKFNGMSHVRRLDLLHTLRRYDFEATVLVIDKRLIRKPVQQFKSGALYTASVGRVIAEAVQNTPAPRVTIDQYFNSEPENQRLITYLRKFVNAMKPGAGEKRVAEFCIGKSSAVHGLQVADAVAGAVAYRYTDDNDVYRAIITSRVNEVHWSGNE